MKMRKTSSEEIRKTSSEDREDSKARLLHIIENNKFMNQ